MKMDKMGIENEKISRSDFFESFARYGILGGFVLLGGFLLVKRKITHESTCTDNFACKSCKKQSKCTLPEKENL